MKVFAEAVVPLVVAAALVLATLALLTTRRPEAALGILLDLLLTAGLLRLSAAATWQALGGTALVIVIRKLAPRAIISAQRSRTSQGSSTFAARTP